MIDVYFVRHGETGGNVAKRHQAEETHLNDRGKAQAMHLRSWVQELHPTQVIVSDRVRAIETAELMLEGNSLIPATDPVFTELQRPRSIYGHYRTNPRALWYLIAWFFGWMGGDGSDGKGESYRVFRTRIQAAREKLQQQPDGSRVVVVSHSVFISFFVAHICDDRPMTPWRAVAVFLKLLRLKNASVTHLQFDPKAGEGTCAWREVPDRV